MDDLISREALKKAIAVARTNYNTCPDYNELFKYFSDIVGAMIDELPAVDAEPVRHGKRKRDDAQKSTVGICEKIPNRRKPNDKIRIR